MELNFSKVLHEKLGDNFDVVTTSEKDFGDWIDRLRWHAEWVAKNGMKLHEYEDAFDNRLLHLAPLPNGTTIYTWQQNDEDEWFVHSESYLYGVTEYFYGEVGKEVFISETECRNHCVN